MRTQVENQGRAGKFTANALMGTPQDRR